jgi:glucokinase
MAALALLADIGGTNTRVALADGTAVRAQSIARFRNADFAGLGDVLRAYMQQAGIGAVDGVCVAAAGPVRGGVAVMTNLDWTIDTPLLQSATGAARCAILNDLQAQGHALGHIAPSDLRPVIAGPQADGAAMLVVGVGTGMNAAPVHDVPQPSTGAVQRIVAPSECGHISMPIRTQRDFDLAQFLASTGPHAHGFAGVEDVLAGRGLERLYAFACLQHTGAEAGVPAAEIMQRLAAGEAQARDAAQLYVQILGAELGNLALIHLPFGGIYLIGGVARAMAPYFDEFGLNAAFCDKGRFGNFMQQFSVQLVEDDYAALTGCAAYLNAAR